jgi:hypothetical protein
MRFVAALPLKAQYSENIDGTLEFQRDTQAEVRNLIRVLPRAVWSKQFVKDCNWWEYTTSIDDVPMHIFAVKEAPANCKAIKEEYQVEEQVPIAFEARTVTKTRLRWECQEEVPNEVSA